MAEENAFAQNLEQNLTSCFPTAYTILLLLIVLIAALTWVIPAGKYERVMNEEVGRGHAVLKRREREHRWTVNAVLGLAHLGGGSGRLGRGRGLDGAGGHLVDVPAGARGRAAAHGLPGCTAAEACGASRDQKPGEDFAVHRIAAREHPTSVG